MENKQSKKHLKSLERARKAKQKERETTENNLEENNDEVSLFRKEEQYWKSRLISPDMSNAFRPKDCCDVYNHDNDDDNDDDDSVAFEWKGRKAEKIRVSPSSSSNTTITIYRFIDYPGFLFIPGYLDGNTQRNLAREAIISTPCHPNSTNLDAHYHIPLEGLWEYRSSLNLIQPKGKNKSKPTTGIESEPVTGTGAGTGSKSNEQSLRRQPVNTEPVTYDSIKSINNNKISFDDPIPSPNSKPLPANILLSKLRWSTVGLIYHWGTKQYRFDQEAPIVPSLMSKTASNLIKSLSQNVYKFDIPNNISKQQEGQNGKIRLEQAQEESSKTNNANSDWSDYKPEAGVVNYYTPKDSLTAHIDHSEPNPYAPLVSLSLGLDAVFLIGGKTRNDTTPLPIYLKSGDACLMTGPCRRVYHGIPRVFKGPLPPAFDPSNIKDEEECNNWKSSGLLEYLSNWRLNINLRQVF